MDYQKETMKLITTINTKLKLFTYKISKEHHKTKDGVWSISYNAWTEEWYVHHNGYWLDDVEATHPNLKKALEVFLEQLCSKIDKEINAYDFERHCAKDE